MRYGLVVMALFILPVVYADGLGYNNPTLPTLNPVINNTISVTNQSYNDTWINSTMSSTYVPYTGATNNVNLSDKNITLWNVFGNTSYIDFLNSQIYDSNNKVSVNWDNRSLKNATGVVMVDWENGKYKVGPSSIASPAFALVTQINTGIDLETNNIIFAVAGQNVFTANQFHSAFQRGFRLSSLVNKAGTYSVSIADGAIAFNGTTPSDFRLTTSQNSWGVLYFFQNAGTAKVTIVPSGTETIDQATNYTIFPNESAVLIARPLKDGWSVASSHTTHFTKQVEATNGMLVNGSINQSVGNTYTNGIYGFMYIHNESNNDTVIDASNTYYNITLMAQAGENNGFTYNNGVLTANVDGVYNINYHIGFSQATGAGAEWHFTIGVNGTERNECHTPRKIGTITDLGSAGTTCTLRLKQNDQITGLISNEDGTDDAIVEDMQVNLNRVGN